MSNRGCWFAVSRCFNSRAPDERTLYSKVSTENIEFEDLAMADKRVAEAKKKKQVVTDFERQHVMNGKLDDLVEHQRRMDEERDAQLRRQEEALRKEEEAYYAAKREAANKRANQVRVPVSLEIQQSDQSDVGFSFPSLPVPMQPSSVSPNGPIPTASAVGKGNVGVATITSIGGRGTVGMAPITSLSTKDSSSSQQKDDDDFDQFLESVKVKQLSITTKSTPSAAPTTPQQPISVGSDDSEEEIDFGFWEKAPVPPGGGGGGGGVSGGGAYSVVRPSSVPETTDKHQRTETPQKVELGLL